MKILLIEEELHGFVGPLIGIMMILMVFGIVPVGGSWRVWNPKFVLVVQVMMNFASLSGTGVIEIE